MRRLLGALRYRLGSLLDIIAGLSLIGLLAANAVVSLHWMGIRFLPDSIYDTARLFSLGFDFGAWRAWLVIIAGTVLHAAAEWLQR